MQNWVNIPGRSQEEDKGIKTAIVALTITMLDLDLEPQIYSNMINLRPVHWEQRSGTEITFGSFVRIQPCA